MDIYQESLAFLGININFDESGIFTCELRADESDEESGQIFTAIKNTTNMTLAISFASNKDLPEPIPDGLFLVFADQALGPIYGGMGLGLLANSRRLVAYKTVSLNNTSADIAEKTFAELDQEITQWNDIIEQVEEGPATPSPAIDAKQNLMKV